MKKSSLFFNLVGILLIPLSMPIFINLRNGNIILSSEFILSSNEIPFPIGGITFSIAMIISYIFSFFNKNAIDRTLDPSSIIKLIIFFILPFSLYSYVISSLSPIRIIQLITPILALSMLSFPKKKYDQAIITFYLFFGAAVFFSFHLLSLAIGHASISSITHIEFSFINNTLIYQSLVSYPGVLTIYIFSSLAIIFSRSTLTNTKILSTIIIASSLTLLSIAARRITIFEITFGLFIYIGTILTLAIKRKKIKINAIFTITTLMFFTLLIFMVFRDSQILTRANESATIGNFDSGRLDIYKNAFNYFLSNPTNLIIGSGGEGAIGFHNYFLDTAYRIGLLGIAILAVISLYIMQKFAFLLQGDYSQENIRTAFLFSLGIIFLLQIMINSAITQPYYAINFLFALLIVGKFVFKKT